MTPFWLNSDSIGSQSAITQNQVHLSNPLLYLSPISHHCRLTNKAVFYVFATLISVCPCNKCLYIYSIIINKSLFIVRTYSSINSNDCAIYLQNPLDAICTDLQQILSMTHPPAKLTIQILLIEDPTWYSHSLIFIVWYI